ncbi:MULTISPECIES: hypothetical protein [Pseudomonas]|uniref:DUF7693 domain-containing protein n=1 Tax=Pseudomonas sp. Hg7Tf TaxID=3236988 RepID=A0AB39I8B1_9PSED|nr:MULTISPECIES: hypothetical protein [unclassified Pseudomonas]MDH2558703.1 hypothetical protein [Pseudomonas sp. Hg5Tf]
MLMLTAREVYQQLRDAAQGIRPLRRLGAEVDIDGWRMTLDFDGARLHHCLRCQSVDGRQGSLDSWPRDTDPVSLLSTWELAQIEHLLVTVPTTTQPART